MTSQVGWLERYWTNVSNVELMFSTNVPGGKISARYLNCNLLSNFLSHKSKIWYFKLIPQIINTDRVY